MSLNGTLKDLEAANKDLTAQLAALQTQSKQTAETHAAALKAAQADVAARVKDIEGLQAKIADLTGQLDVAVKAKAAADQELAATKGDLGIAKARLANPAFGDAAALGQKTPPKDGGETEARQTDEQFYAAYRAETNPEKRAEMWRKRMGV
jgi:septal ring factor EnvC (AmiA/AmiB activator)